MCNDAPQSLLNGIGGKSLVDFATKCKHKVHSLIPIKNRVWQLWDGNIMNSQTKIQIEINLEKSIRRQLKQI
jgi:hypothetical protein